jgi:hypothetical protein
VKKWVVWEKFEVLQVHEREEEVLIPEKAECEIFSFQRSVH